MFYITYLNDALLCDRVLQIRQFNPNIGIRICRGEKMKTTAELFAEISAAFQFPYYFGENWAAFEDCMSELSWFYSDSYVMVVANANELLTNEAETSLRQFLSSMRTTINGWAGANPNLAIYGRKPTEFKLFFQLKNEKEKDRLKRNVEYFDEKLVKMDF